MYFIEVTAAEERKSFIPLKGDSMHSWPVAFYGKNWLTKINDDGTLNPEKVDRLVEKYGTPFSDRFNRNNNNPNTIIIKEQPRSGVNINIGR